MKHKTDELSKIFTNFEVFAKMMLQLVLLVVLATEVDAAFGCKWRTGGTPSALISKRYRITGLPDCARKCIDRRRTDKRVNGAVHSRGRCSCVYGLTEIKIMPRYNACFLTEPLPAKGKCKKNFAIPDAKGVTDSTPRSPEDCLKFCTDKKKDNSDINASLSSTSTGCMCVEKAMGTTKLDGHMTCTIGTLVPTNVEYVCKLVPGKIFGSYMGSMVGQDCINACLVKKEGDNRINAVEIDYNLKTCACGRNEVEIIPDARYRSCLLKPKEFLIKSSTAIRRNNLVKTVTMEKEYTVTFDVFATALLYGWRSVIHFTASGRNAGKYGDRIPAVYFYGNKICIASAVSGNLNYYVYSKPVKAKQWYTVVIKQTKEGDGKYWYTNTVDGKSVTRKVNTDPRRFENVKVYVSDPWYYPAAGKIRNLSVTVG